ncbi:MAG: hypothetical protein ABWY36_01235 [Leifsonia sp.]
MSSLTDRYVWAAVRTAPEKQRPELEQEVRSLVADTTEAKLEAGSPTAERDAIVELGDPQVLAARYADRPLVLIGPAYYLVWQRLLKLLLVIVVPFAALGIGIGQFIAEASPGAIIGSLIGGAIGVAVHLCFWVTVVFAVLDRTTGGKPIIEWNPDTLPELPSSTKQSALGELIASVAFLALFLVVLVWQQFNPWVTEDGSPVPVLDPSLWSFWLPWFIGLTIAEIAFAFVAYFRGWSYPLAAVNVLLNIAFAVPAIWLLLTGSLFNPAFLEVIAAHTDDNFDDAMRITGIVIVAVIVAICAWDVIDGFLRAHRARRPALATA